ncbi:MAG: alpha/beta fold hydrolase [Bacteroidia bacterium]|jgi:hypothetical protein|nr:alpha/beta fold hydrolase [Bacteroidia bacterium]
MILTDYPVLKAGLLYKNKHFATIVPALFRKHEVHYVRNKITTPDDDFFLVDCIQRNQSKAVVLIHGLEGSSASQYIKGFAKLFADNGYDVHAINFRSCGGEMNNKLTSYHSGYTDDLAYYLQLISKKYAQLYAIGFSLGGNALLKYLSNKSVVPGNLVAAAAVSVPVDLKGSAFELDKGTNRIYMQRFLNSLSQKILKKHKQFPGQLDIKGLHKIKNFKEFDDAYTAPIHGFKDAYDYWDKCSSIFSLNTIDVPTLLINAKNDPFLNPGCFPYEEIVDHPFLHGIFTSHGGHVGFMMNSKQSWLEPVIFNFFED